MATKGLRGWNRRDWVSLVPFGLNQQEHANGYRGILKAVWENRDSLGYAWRILRDGCCDGCSLGTRGMRDWTVGGIHLCALRLRRMRLNTMPAMDWRVLEDVTPLAGLQEEALRRLGRLAVPMVREKGEKGFRRVTWDQAIAVIAEKLRQTDPRGLAWHLASRGLTNEAYYAHQKVARFIGTNHIDTSARTCYDPGAAALKAALGCKTATCSYEDWIGSDLVVFVGTNLAGNQPVANKYLYYARKAGTRVFVVNPNREPCMERGWIPSVAESALFGTRLADDFFQVLPGGDVPFFFGVLKHLIQNNWLDRDFIQDRTRGWLALEKKARRQRWEELERGSGLARADMLRFAEALGKARRAVFVWGTGVTDQRYGSDNVHAIVNLQLARGNVGRPHSGVMPIPSHSGVEGGAEMGALPRTFVTGFSVNEENAEHFALPDVWGFRPPAWKGMSAAEMMLGAERGEIDMLWQSGGDFLDTLPEPERACEALTRLRLRVHQDVAVNPAMLADPGETVVLLPARNRYEQRGGGTETSSERRVIYSPEIPGPRPGEARDEWEIPVLVARYLDPEGAAKAFPWKDTSDIRAEIDNVCPAYHGIGKLRSKGDSFQRGGPRLLAGSFATPGGKGRFSSAKLPQERIPKGKFLLSAKRARQFTCLMLRSNGEPMGGVPRDDVTMAAEDAQRLGLHAGDRVVLWNQHQRFRGKVRIERIKPGCLEVHWPEGRTLTAGGRREERGVANPEALVEVSRA